MRRESPPWGGGGYEGWGREGSKAAWKMWLWMRTRGGESAKLCGRFRVFVSDCCYLEFPRTSPLTSDPSAHPCSSSRELRNTAQTPETTSPDSSGLSTPHKSPPRCSKNIQFLKMCNTKPGQCYDSSQGSEFGCWRILPLMERFAVMTLISSSLKPFAQWGMRVMVGVGPWSGGTPFVLIVTWWHPDLRALAEMSPEFYMSLKQLCQLWI